jgi:nitric oxide reductase NorE protein
VDAPIRQAVDSADTNAPRPPAAVSALPGDAGFWTFIAADAILFALLFFQFSLDRSHHAQVFDAGRGELVITLGAVNTLVLVTSSWLMARGVRSASLGDIDSTLRWITGTVSLGGVFAVLKITEYVLEIRFGHAPSTSTFFMYYFMITGIHLVHLLAGVIALSAISLRLRSAPNYGRNRVFLECGASYWHLVDLLWMFIFPLLYLAR